MRYYTKGDGKAFTILVCGMLILSSACVKQSRNLQFSADQKRPQELTAAAPQQLVNVNTAPSETLEKLPNLGPTLAERIVEHRSRHGRFRRVEHLIAVRGISRRRFEEIRPFITID